MSSVDDMKYWLFKSEPDTFSIEMLKSKGTAPWDGVRNFQARNFLRDEVQKGDRVLFYHSSCEVPGVVGCAEVVRAGYPDSTAWDKESLYYDPKSTREKPLWYMVDVRYKSTFPHIVSLAHMREMNELTGMKLLQKGSRLSIQPVSRAHFEHIVKSGSKNKHAS